MAKFTVYLEPTPLGMGAIEVEAANHEEAARIAESQKPTCHAFKIEDEKGAIYHIQKPGWAPEPACSLRIFFFTLDNSFEELASELDIDCVCDAARDAVAAGKNNFRFDPVEWDCPDNSMTYRCSLKHLGEHAECGLAGELYEVGLVSRRPRSKKKGGR